MADANKQAPSRIEILKAGTWPQGSNKGALSITLDDLQEFKRNFDNGVGMSVGMRSLPIDFSHNDWSQAAGWMTDLIVEGDTLYADVEWSTSGRAALEGGEYKCVSPSFWPACLGEWTDPEDPSLTARNVLCGAGLTNIPFFKGLTPIMASTAQQGRSDKNIIYVSEQENHRMTLDEVRIKAAADLTDEDRQVLADNKDQLSADELDKFNMAAKPAAPAPAPVAADNKPVSGVSDADKAVLASIKDGSKVLIEASAYKGMEERLAAIEADRADMKKKEVQEVVKAHIARGAIVADQADNWTKLIMADASNEDMLKALPGQKALVNASVSGTDDAQDVDASKQFEEKVQEAIKASNGSLGYGQAVIQVAQANPTLANDREKQLKNA
jgi:hypothetical protein